MTSKTREQAVTPNLTFHVFAWPLFFFQTFAQIEKFSCGQHVHFEPAPQTQAARTIEVSSLRNAGVKAASALLHSSYMGAAC